MFSNMAVNFLVHGHSPYGQRDLRGNIVRSKTGEFVHLTYGSKNVQSPIYKEETARGGSFCGSAENRSDPIASYVTVMIFDA